MPKDRYGWNSRRSGIRAGCAFVGDFARRRSAVPGGALFIAMRPRPCLARCRLLPANRNGAKAQIMMIGEQPGDREDKEGRPFVGPAGKLLDRCLKAAGIDRKEVYVTNAVKHFKWEPRGKLRIHKKPAASEVLACRPWLEAEIDAVCPQADRLPGRRSCSRSLGHRVQGDKKPRHTPRGRRSASYRGYGSSRLYFACIKDRRPGTSNGQPHRGSAKSRSL